MFLVSLVNSECDRSVYNCVNYGRGIGGLLTDLIAKRLVDVFEGTAHREVSKFVAEFHQESTKNVGVNLVIVNRKIRMCAHSYSTITTNKRANRSCNQPAVSKQGFGHSRDASSKQFQ